MPNLTSLILLLTTCLAIAAQKLPTVGLLSTGGTIASKQDPSKGGYVPTLSGEDLVSAPPAIKKIAQVQVEQIANIPSQDITSEIWVRVAARVNELLAKPEIAAAAWSLASSESSTWKRSVSIRAPLRRQTFALGAAHTTGARRYRDELRGCGRPSDPIAGS